MGASRALRRAYDHRLAPLGLNLSEASVLAFCSERGPLTQTQIADRIGMGRASAGALIDNLERRDLLVRRPDPMDRRVWLVATTPAACPVVAKIAQEDATLRQELRSGISRTERQRLARTLVRLQANLAAIAENSP